MCALPARGWLIPHKKTAAKSIELGPIESAMLRGGTIATSHRLSGRQTPDRRKLLFEWASAILISLGLAVAIGELVLRVTSIKVPPILNGVYFSEHPQQFRDQYTAFGYQPFSNNREGAVYSDYNDAWVEYDVRFTVNNAGLVQRRPIDGSQNYTVLVGDSFVHGLGAAP